MPAVSIGVVFAERAAWACVLPGRLSRLTLKSLMK